jgi:hypothetical protein
MNIVKFLVLVLTFAYSASSFAGGNVGDGRERITTVETTGVDTVLDIPLRLSGFVMTLVGTGIFIGTSPITGLMTALPPHNAIQQAGDYLVVRPANYTFVRPTGNSSYDSRPRNEQ